MTSEQPTRSRMTVSTVDARGPDPGSTWTTVGDGRPVDGIGSAPPAASGLVGADTKPLHPDRSRADREIRDWQRESAFHVPPAPGGKPRHIVETLIRERAPKLSASRLWPLLRPALYRLLGYRKGVELVNVAGRMNATDAFALASDRMGVRLEATGTHHIPRTGGFIMVLNHPTGIADGLAAHDLVLRTRPDPMVFVNGDAIRLNPRLTGKLIPVEWRDEKKSRARSRETLRATRKAFEEGRPIILFPSGRLSYMDADRRLRERPWMPSVALLARKYGVPVVPVHLRARNSRLFYLLWRLNEELRDMMVFLEWFNKRGTTFSFTVQSPIGADELLPDNDAAADELREYVEGGIEQGLSFQAWRKARSREPGTASPTCTGQAQPRSV